MAYSRTTTDLQMLPQDRVVVKAHFNGSFCCSQGQRPVLTWPLAATPLQIPLTPQQVNGSPYEFLLGDGASFFFPCGVGATDTAVKNQTGTHAGGGKLLLRSKGAFFVACYRVD